jgi:hypothetical protein
MASWRRGSAKVYRKRNVSLEPRQLTRAEVKYGCLHQTGSWCLHCILQVTPSSQVHYDKLFNTSCTHTKGDRNCPGCIGADLILRRQREQDIRFFTRPRAKAQEQAAEAEGPHSAE